ncbi:MAG: transglycosylase SLT domain-containing protein, partial [Flavobacteriaceae bacterium]|nr:transglycosylase SLT domain-containing protein [Flavobacteriaceae bacterium]
MRCFLFFFFVVMLSLAQEGIPPTIEADSIKNDTLIKKPTFKEYPYAVKMDSLWLKELYSLEIYDTIQKIIQTEKFDTIPYKAIPTDTLKKRLAALNDKTPFNIEYNETLESVINRFLKNRKKSLQRLMALSEFYFPMFERELDAKNIPLELKYLAIVESALNPRAKSRVGATGLWQFMFVTGKEHGLDVSSYVDERSDPIMSTKAACVFLDKLYKRFGDWDLALAAYNSGPGNVSKAIRRSGGHTNYWNIRSYLPRETAGYVPIFQATMYVMEYADEYELVADKSKYRHFETDTVRVKEQLGLEHVSELMDISLEELQFLNPSYKLDIIPKVKDEAYYIRLPKYAIGDFVSNEDSIYAYSAKIFNQREKALPELTKVSSRIRYKVRKGDYLGKIANRYGVRVSQIKRWNGLRTNNLSIGQRLTIYPRRTSSSKTSKKKSSTTTTKTTNKNITGSSYTVVSGDTLYGIAKKFPGISSDNIKEWNNLGSS